MPEDAPPSPANRLDNLSHLLDHALTDPSILLAQEFVGEARCSMAAGDLSTAQRAMALAEMALRFGGHPTPGLPPAALGPSAARGEGGPEPPHPPTGHSSNLT
ncbi:MAG: hypothetical protein ACYDFT_02080 [Thermoplasmata archaeon]